MAIIDGTEDADIITPSHPIAGQPSVTDGDDSISGHGGDDTLDGGLGNDTIQGGAGADKLEGGTGVNTVSYASDTDGVTVDLTKQVTFSTDGAYTPTPASGNEQHGGDAEGDLLASFRNIVGGSGDDTLTGDNNNNVIEGGAGADTLTGGGGDDTLVYSHDTAGVTLNLAAGIGSGGEAQGDIISGFTNVVGGSGDNSLSGAGGGVANIIEGGAGADLLDGDAEDTVSYAGDTQGVTVDLGASIASGGDAEGDQVYSFGNIAGGSGNDTLAGDGTDNVLTGNDGDDRLIGRGGHDTLDGGAGSDTADYSGASTSVTVNLVTQTASNDGNFSTDILISIENVIGGSQGDNITGDDGDNVIVGNGGFDTIHGGAGNDTLSGGPGPGSYLFGDDGNDILIGRSGDELHGEGLGADTADYSAYATGVTVDLSSVGGPDSAAKATVGGVNFNRLIEIENVTGSDYDDTLSGGDVIKTGVTSIDNVLSGGAGNDTISGQGGNDTISGGSGADTLDGGTGTDTLDYGSSLLGVTITLANGAAAKVAGGDAVGDVATNFENVTGSSISGNTLTGDNGNNVLIGGDFIDKIVGGAGDDTLEGGGGPDALDGGAGFDTVSYENATFGQSVTLGASGKASSLTSEHDTLTAIERLVGSSFNDILQGNNLADTLEGGAGNDNLDGSGGNDTLLGGLGNDTITGGAGDDSVEGGGGNDTLTGGGGNDSVSYAHASAGVTVSLAIQDGTTAQASQSGDDANGDVLSNFRNLIGSSHNDVLIGGSDGNTIVGGDGADNITGGSGNDIIEGGAGGDTLNGGGGVNTLSYAGDTTGVTVNFSTHQVQGGDAGSDVITWSSFANLTGGSGNDILTGDGNANGNVIQGNAGDDTIAGGAGNDTLDGGAGFDIVDYSASAAVVVDLSKQYKVTNGAFSGGAVQGGGDAIGDKLANFEGVLGSGNADVIIGSAGNDYIDGNSGLDTLDGGAGFDTLSFASQGSNAVIVDLSQPADANGSFKGYLTLNGAGGIHVKNFENLLGTSGDDTLTGDKNANLIDGGSGTANDTMDGGAGIDTVSYAHYDAMLTSITLGHRETDGTITGASGAPGSIANFENLIGTRFHDDITGVDNFSSTIDGGAGNDYIAGGTAADKLSGGTGDDTVSGGAGADVLDGGTGGETDGDTLDYSYLNSPSKITVTLGALDSATGISLATKTSGSEIDTISNFENIEGGLGNDSLTGNDAANHLVGSDGDDVLIGNGGDDSLEGGRGNDTLTGGAGIDNISGDDGNDIISGGDGNDTISGGDGDDIIEGGAGKDILDGGNTGETNGDTVSFAHSTAGVIVNLGFSGQTLGQSDAPNGGGGDADTSETVSEFENIIGSAFDDALYGTADAATTIINRIDGGAGNDFITGGTGADLLIGGDGSDTLNYYQDAAGVIVDLSKQATLNAATGALTGGTDGIGGDAQGDKFNGFENIIGGSGVDTLTGDDNANIIIGSLGNDIISGGAGNDTLGGLSLKVGLNTSPFQSTSGDDNIDGGAGNDLIIGDDGTDTLKGGIGTDTLTYQNSTSVFVDLTLKDGTTAQAATHNFGFGSVTNGDAAGDILSGFEAIIGSAFDDDLSADTTATNTIGYSLSGGGGDDKLHGSFGKDTFSGGSGNDEFSVGLDHSVVKTGGGGDIIDGGDGTHDFVSFGVGGPNHTLAGITITLGVNGTLTGFSATGGDATGDKITNVEGIGGTWLADKLTGNSLDNELNGGAFGNDILIGLAGDDVLEGIHDSDTLIGGAGNDILDGGGDTDIVNDGVDTVDYSASAQGVTVNLSQEGTYIDPTDTNVGRVGDALVQHGGDAEGDRLWGIEQVIGSAHDDILTSGANVGGPVRLDGGAGNDIIVASDNTDTLIGGAGVDTLSYQNSTHDLTIDLSHQSTIGANGILSAGTGGGDAVADQFTGFENATSGSGNDALTGDSTANVLSGGAGSDRLTGNAGDDTLIGGVGNNILDGGAGNDTASYAGMSDSLLIDLGVSNPYAENTGVTFTDTLTSIENIVGGSGDDSIVGSSGNNVLSGGDGLDTILGGAGNDIISGGAGNDGDSATGLFGDGGNDTINGDDGNDMIEGGAGADKMDGGDGSDMLAYMGVSGQSITVNLATNKVTAVGVGALAEASGDTIKNFESIAIGDGNNTLIGDSGSNQLSGGVGNDTLVSGGGFDLLAGGLGNDTYIVHGSEQIFDNAFFGGGGIDTVQASVDTDLTSFAQADIENLTLTGTAAINGAGNAFANVITGNSAANMLLGREGNDTIIGGLGADNMDGGDDVDTLSYVNDTKGVTVDLGAGTASGAAGSEAAGDTIANFENVTGGKGIDRLTGSAGDNVIVGSLGNDVLDGAGGSDTLDYSGATAGVTVNLYTGKATGGDGADTISNFENVIGSAKNDVISGSADVNILAGGDGIDTLDYSGSVNVNGVDINLVGNILSGGDAQGDTISGFENANGTNSNDSLFGTGDANVLNGLGGDDNIYATHGADTMDGGSGGEIGGDTLSYSGFGAAVTVKLGAYNTVTGASALATVGGDAAGQKAINFENVSGTEYNDALTGNAGVNLIIGSHGDDLIAGGLGADKLDGGQDTDTVDYSASAQVVTVSLATQGAVDGFGNADFNSPGAAQGGIGSDAAGDLLWNFENVIGSKGNDTLTGDNNDNVIVGGLGNDTLNGAGGNDTLDYSGAAAAVTVNLFSGQVTGGAGTDAVSNFENVIGTKFNDIISGSDQVNVLTGGGGNDTLDYSSSANSGINIDLAFNNASGGDAAGDVISSFVNVNGTSASDTLVGDSNANVIKGNGGDDLIMGRGGADKLDGGTGGETYGDTVQYAESFQSVTVTLGVYDALHATSGLATVSGGDAAGDQLTNFENLNGSNNVGDRLTGNAGVNRIRGLQGDDVIAGGAGTGVDYLDGGAGNDTVDYSASAQAVTVLLADQGPAGFNDGNGDADFVFAGTAQHGGDAEGDLLWNFENVIGSKNDDTLTGDDNDNIIVGGLGNDTLNGGNGSDTLDYSGATLAVTVDLYNGHVTGGAGIDTISNFENVIGTAKNDLITGSTAVNHLDGGIGLDTLDYSASVNSAGVTIDLGANTASGGDAAGDTISGFENINGTSHNDALTGSSVANIINGNDGNDTIEGGAGADKLDGGAGNDDVLTYAHSVAAVTVTLGAYNATTHTSGPATVSGGDAAGDTSINFENLTGGSGNDILTGNAGANVLAGRGGNDTLTGGAQVDIMTGGAGADIFNYLNKTEIAGSSDFISDFSSADGDKIGISKSGFGIAASINATTFTSGHYFDEQAGHTATGVAHAQFIFDTATSELYYDADGQAGGELVFAHLSDGANALAHMSASDFLLK